MKGDIGIYSLKLLCLGFLIWERPHWLVSVKCRSLFGIQCSQLKKAMPSLTELYSLNCNSNQGNKTTASLATSNTPFLSFKLSTCSKSHLIHEIYSVLAKCLHHLHYLGIIGWQTFLHLTILRLILFLIIIFYKIFKNL